MFSTAETHPWLTEKKKDMRRKLARGVRRGVWPVSRTESESSVRIIGADEEEGRGGRDRGEGGPSFCCPPACPGAPRRRPPSSFSRSLSVSLDLSSLSLFRVE
eukprot:scaffold207511_cov30-Tisochrysis_lutea.AAC.2